MITPRPDKCIVLRVPLEVIKKRGHDASQENLKNFYYHLEKLSEHFPMSFIDSSEPVEKTFEKINRIINK